MLEKIMKLVPYFFFLSLFTYYLLLVVQAKKEWMTEEKLGYFQTQLLFPRLQLFRGVECLSWTSKIAIFLVELSIGIWERVFFFFFCAKKPIFSGMRRLPFLSDAFKEIVIFVFIYFILCLFYFYLLKCYWAFFFSIQSPRDFVRL